MSDGSTEAALSPTLLLHGLSIASDLGTECMELWSHLGHVTEFVQKVIMSCDQRNQHGRRHVTHRCRS